MGGGKQWRVVKEIGFSFGIHTMMMMSFSNNNKIKYWSIINKREEAKKLPARPSREKSSYFFELYLHS
jgi:hypothetical protein